MRVNRRELFAAGVAIGASASIPVAASVGLVPTYAFYAVSALVSFFFVRALIHETRGREPEHMIG